MDLNRINPVSLIAGAASGIGAACARSIARRSDGGLILVDDDAAALDAAADQLANNAPERVSTLAFDVSDPDRWDQAAAFIKSQYGRIDWALINACVPASTSESDLVDWRSVTSTNFDGAALTLRAVAPLMKSNVQGGAIVISASAASIKADPNKAGLLQFVRAAAKEGAASNVRVNAIVPGGAETPMWASMPWFQDIVAETGGEREAFEKIATLPTPIARYAKSDDIARPIIMLLSDENPITGATLVVDGGYTL